MFKSIQCVFVAMMSVGFAAQPTLYAAEPADSQTPASAFRLGAPFRDGAVLQRGMKVSVWGWSKPGTKVTVEFAPQHGAGQAGQENSAKADKSGKWMVWLDPLEASFEPAVKAGKDIPRDVPGNLRSNRDASWLYNGRLSPVVPYAIRGAIWNQGYANSSEGISYYNNLHSLIRGWRTVWNKPELPVYFHQFYSPGDSSKPSINSWSEMRLGTWLARDIPHAGMASQIDIGGAVHYRKLIRKSHRHRRYLYRWQRRSHRTTHRRIGAGECSVEGDVKMEVE